MKLLVGNDIGTYTFNASAQTVTFSGIDALTKENILLVTNVEDNVVLYQFNSTANGGSFASNVLSLSYDTTSMADSDPLQIFIDYPAVPAYKQIKSSDLHNPYTFMPRNHMHDVNSKRAYDSISHQTVSLCFVPDEDDIGYPNSAAGYPNGFNLLGMGTTISGAHGVYLAPEPNMVVYIYDLVFTVEFANEVDIYQPIDKDGQLIRLYHNGHAYCSIDSMTDMFTMAGEVIKSKSVFTPDFYTYSIRIPCIPPGRFEGVPLGDTGYNEYFRLATSNGNNINSDYMTEFYVSFKTWTTELDKET